MMINIIGKEYVKLLEELKMKVSRICENFPYTGVRDWALICSVTFIVLQFLWYLSSYVRGCDFLEIPMVFLYFPFAPLIDPHDAMLHNDYIYLYALAYWILFFLLSWKLSLRKVNPILPGIVVLIQSCLPGLISSIYIIWRGPHIEI
jgi:hypothetical protein